ncbi:hypothetical protein B0T22DRAFT_147219 [Podospora appendiculata]|uniref:Cut9-interacting protein scn1 n=1 Tax=Podospora appendiculata TaxID=314037 RepID=A0AAE0X8R8_9PEZI|nr:hypothetical protein B0T22DRAFT_147219 [Podospora appendiculata]
MCSPTEGQTLRRASDDSSNVHAESFPWHVGVCDAHCHPTDTMSSITTIRDMQARVLTVMATRAEDQDLVASVAAGHGVQSRDELASPSSSATGLGKIVPAFGWHPWFSHQLYDDTATDDATQDPSQQLGAQKTKHYNAVLTPAPDVEFLDSLPDPRPISDFISETRQRLAADSTSLIGEIGLDKAFRLPLGWNQSKESQRIEGLTPGGREGRMLSPYHVKMPHQVQVLKAQLRLAGELGRPVSVHGVQAHGVLFDSLASLWKGHEKEVISKRQQKLVAAGAEDFSSSEDEDEDEYRSDTKDVAKPYQPKPFPPRICLHSFSGPPQMLNQYLNPAIPAKIFFSFSMVVNLSTPGGETKFAEVIRACPDDQLLVESDLHTAGGDMDYYLEQMYRKVCDIKGWALLDGVERIRKNYGEFLFG